MKPAICRAKFLSKTKISRDVYEFSFDMIDPIELDFLPGQYISIEIDPKTRRQYSLSISPYESKKLIKIIVDIRPNGLGVTYLMGLQSGDEIKFIGQIGLFVLPEQLSDNLFFIATNTGVAPLKSMIETLINKDLTQTHKIHLYYGTRYGGGILFKDLFSSYYTDGKISEYRIALSKDTVTNCDRGHVTQYVELIKPSVHETHQFFLCGSGSMIESVEKIIKDNGFEDESLYFEKFY